MILVDPAKGVIVPEYVEEQVVLKQCPYCLRKFNHKAAQRHIPNCKDIKAKPKPPPNIILDS